MKLAEFRKLSREYFGRVLEPQGFQCGGQKATVCWRQVNDSIVHFVLADLSVRLRSWYDIRAFALSPLVEPVFPDGFPDKVSDPSLRSYLHPVAGLGHQHSYGSDTADEFIRSFVEETEPALRRFALPYLDGITSLGTLLPTIGNTFYRGRLLGEMGRRTEGLEVLRNELKRISAIRDGYKPRTPGPDPYFDMLVKAIADLET